MLHLSDPTNHEYAVVVGRSIHWLIASSPCEDSEVLHLKIPKMCPLPVEKGIVAKPLSYTTCMRNFQVAAYPTAPVYLDVR